MKIRCNGEMRDINNNTSILSFLAAEGINPKNVIVEYNSEQYERNSWDDILLHENDILEVIKFIVGG